MSSSDVVSLYLAYKCTLSVMYGFELLAPTHKPPWVAGASHVKRALPPLSVASALRLQASSGRRPPTLPGLHETHTHRERKMNISWVCGARE